MGSATFPEPEAAPPPSPPPSRLPKYPSAKPKGIDRFELEKHKFKIDLFELLRLYVPTNIDEEIARGDKASFYLVFDKCFHSVLKFFQVDNAGMWRMTSSARSFKEGVDASRPSWRWIMCFLERPKANTSCRAVVKCCRRLWGASEDTKSSMTSTRHSTCTFDLKLTTVYAGRLFLSWASWAGGTNSA